MSKKNFIGVDLGGTSVKAARVEDENIVKTFENATPANSDDPQIAIDAVINAIEKVIDENTTAIGIGVPSVVDRRNGIVYDVQNIPSWKEVHIKDILNKKFNLPIYVDNDANCFAIGEKIFGKGQQYENFVGLTLGTGLGSGIVNRGRLLDDANCGSGEFGEIPYLNFNYEYYCSSSYFSNIVETSGKDLYDRAIDGDAEAVKYFYEFGLHISSAVKLVVLSIDPQMVVFGGSISKSFKLFEQGMIDGFKDFPYQKSIADLDIFVSDLNNAALYGAAALCF